MLLVLAAGPNHGYGIMEDVSALTDGRFGIGAGTTYRSTAALLEAGLIERIPASEEKDPRRRTYRITRRGRALVCAEIARLRRLVRIGERSCVQEDGGSGSPQ